MFRLFRALWIAQKVWNWDLWTLIVGKCSVIASNLIQLFAKIEFAIQFYVLELTFKGIRRIEAGMKVVIEIARRWPGDWKGISIIRMSSGEFDALWLRF